MTSPRAGLRVAAFLFGVICIAHIVRLLQHLPVTVGTFEVPQWPSLAGAIVSGALSLWMWSLSAKQG